METVKNFNEVNKAADSSNETDGYGDKNLGKPNSNFYCGQRGHYLKRRLKFFKSILKEIRKQQRQLKETVDVLGLGYQKCIHIAANCQEQATKILNDYHERHALYPAIKTVVLLVDELFRLNELTKTLQEEAKGNGELQRIIEELQISASIAQDRLADLDIEKITANTGDSIDTQLHTLHGHIDTPDDSLHGKISQLLKLGIMYQGKVLRPAKVSAFRCCKVNDS